MTDTPDSAALDAAIATVEAAGLYVTTQPRVVFDDNQIDGHQAPPLVLSTPLPAAATDPMGADGEVPADVRHLIDATCDEIWRYAQRLRGGDPHVIVNDIPGVDSDTRWRGVIVNDWRYPANKARIAAFTIQHAGGDLTAWREHAEADHAALARVAELAAELNARADRDDSSNDYGLGHADALADAARHIGEALTGVRAIRAQPGTQKGELR